MSADIEPDRQTSPVKGEDYEHTDHTGFRIPAEKGADAVSRYYLRNRSCRGG